MNTTPPHPEDALPHLGWVRALALSLVRDANVAEDVVQEAFLLALERPPSKQGRLAPWLARVTRTFARQAMRSSNSRRAREQRFASESKEVQGTEPFEIYERGQRQRMVADAVLALPEPYASTVLYHYLDGLPTAEVAERMGTTGATVRKRLERARALLRERLDEEFGCETHSWALGVLLPAAGSGALTPATGAVSTGTKTLVSGGLMGSKTIGVAGLTLAAGLLVVVGNHLSTSDTEARELPAITEDLGVPEQEHSNFEPETQLRVSNSRSEVASVPSPQASMAPELQPAVSVDETVLLVRVLSPAGEALASGRIDCFWDPEDRLGHGRLQTHLRRPIEGAVTRIQLPPDARSVRVCASHVDFQPAPGVTLNALRSGADGTALEGSIVHEVDVPLLGDVQGPYIHGNIYLDGQLDCPRGLRVFLNGVGQTWINTLNSSYRFGPITKYGGSLHVQSDFSIPTLYELDEDRTTDQRIDLRLESGRELLVHAVDGTTGAPAIGREILLSVSNPVQRELTSVLYHSHDQVARVNAAGYCRFEGVPLEGQAGIGQRLEDGIGRLRLETLHLERDMPQVVECEVRLQDTATVKTRVFGSLPIGESAGTDGRRTVILNPWGARGPSEVAEVDAKGHWSAELNSHQAWTLHAELDGQRRSEEKIIELKGEAEKGPIQLGWQGSHEVTLHLIDVPLTGQVEIEATEVDGGARQRFRLQARGEDLEQSLLLSGRAKVQVSVIPIGGDSDFGLQHSLDVDPLQEREHFLDLGGSRALELTFRMGGEFPAGDGMLILVSPGPEQTAPKRVLFQLHEGQTSAAQTLDAGPWIYLLIHEEYPGLIMGWLDVPETPTGILAIDWQGTTVPTNTLGKGLEIESIEGRSIGDWLPPLSKLPWRPEQLDQPKLWMPQEISYEVTE